LQKKDNNWATLAQRIPIFPVCGIEDLRLSLFWGLDFVSRICLEAYYIVYKDEMDAQVTDKAMFDQQHVDRCLACIAEFFREAAVAPSPITALTVRLFWTLYSSFLSREEDVIFADDRVANIDTILWKGLFVPDDNDLIQPFRERRENWETFTELGITPYLLTSKKETEASFRKFVEEQVLLKWCICNRIEGECAEKMVQCVRAAGCIGKQWYCVSCLEERQVIVGEIFECPTCLGEPFPSPVAVPQSNELAKKKKSKRRKKEDAAVRGVSTGHDTGSSLQGRRSNRTDGRPNYALLNGGS
jgi:hypothetical protein